MKIRVRVDVAQKPKTVIRQRVIATMALLLIIFTILFFIEPHAGNASTTSVNINTEKEFIKIEKVYPDTFTDWLRVKYNCESNLVLLVAICNNNGDVVYNIEEEAQTGLNEMEMKPRNVCGGAYTLIFSDLTGRRKSVRVVKAAAR
jgi:hypothetical protein